MAPESDPRYIIIPGLPAPYKGVTEEVLTEIASDRIADFTSSVLIKMITENPALEWLVHASILTSAQSFVTLSNFAAYYEIFSRSAEKEGVPMIVVSKRTVTTWRKKYIGLSKQNLSLEELDKEVVRQMQERREKDTQKSAELGDFWDYIESVRLVMKKTGYSQAAINSVFNPLFTLQELLHEQERRNRELQAEAYRNFND
jgi:hypothetical protein